MIGTSPTLLEVETARATFPALARTAYLNAGTAGPLAEATAEAMARYQALDLRAGRASAAYWDDALALRDDVRRRIAALLGATADHIALTGSTSDGCRIVIAGLGLRSGDEVVTTDCEHAGLLAPLHASGATIRVAEIRDRPADQAYDAIEAELTSRTRLLALSHVTWTTGQRLPVHELKERARIPVLVDGAQAAGAITVDVGAIDFYTVSGHKWLNGPDSTGALYVRNPDDLPAVLPSVLAYADSRTLTLEPNASRFDWGWHARASLAGLLAAIDARPAWAETAAAAAARRCRELLLEHGTAVRSEAGQSTLVSFESRGDAEAAAVAAERKGVIIRSLPGTNWLRASCGYWTTDHDLERLVDTLQTG
jgi:L-cysteine/cystine lyase